MLKTKSKSPLLKSRPLWRLFLDRPHPNKLTMLSKICSDWTQTEVEPLTFFNLYLFFVIQGNFLFKRHCG